MGLFTRAADRSGTPADLLVVGLGNPGAEHHGSRHNLGAEVVESLARRNATRLSPSKQRAVTAEVVVDGRRLALAFPQTYMNLSGDSVALLVRRYGITDPAQIVVVHDELDLPIGSVKVKLGGGLAGHNGLKSVKQHLHTDGFARVRIGVGRPPGRREGADHVLGRPGKSERAELDVAVEVAADAVELIARSGVDAAMAEVNGR